MRVNDFDFIHVSQKLKRWWLYSNLKIDSAGVYVFSKLWNNSVLQKCENKAQCAKAHVVNKVCMVMDAFIVPKTKERNKSVPCYALSLHNVHTIGVIHKRCCFKIYPFTPFCISLIIWGLSCTLSFGLTPPLLPDLEKDVVYGRYRVGQNIFFICHTISTETLLRLMNELGTFFITFV